MIKDSCIYIGNVIHKRFKPKEHYFKYKVFSLLLDLNEISIMVVIMVLSCIIFTIRLEDYGCPSIFKKISKCCKDELCNDEEEEN